MLENISTEDLRHTLAEREGIERSEQMAEAARLRAVIEKNVAVFLLLYPTHGRTSCSDAEPVNAYHARCSRCVLLHVDAHGYLPDEIIVETGLLFNYEGKL